MRFTMSDKSVRKFVRGLICVIIFIGQIFDVLILITKGKNFHYFSATIGNAIFN